MTQNDLTEHKLVFSNDDLTLTLAANVRRDTWTRLVVAVMDALAKPSAVIAFQEQLSAEDIAEFRAKWWPAKGKT